MPHCSKRHENPAGSRFCLQCGERLLLTGKGIYLGLLGDRYQIIRQLGQGGFGRTYLAEDTNRFCELCVLKEFAPQVQGTQALQKAEELFEREAGVLYNLQHPQIPRFRELLRVNLDGKGYLFLVQDYVDGQTFHALLAARKQQGMLFNELEVTQLLLQTLPVLEYIHSQGVIHRDISPDNLILRNSDHLPVLIDFGGVKQVAATVASHFAQPTASISSATLLGKIGYSPYEQMQMGRVYPHSDLYALAVTVLVLLTGKEPQELIDGNTLTWNWRREIQLRSIGAVLDKMLSQHNRDRYQSAHQVLQALTDNIAVAGSTPHTLTPHTQATIAVPHSPKVPSTNPQQMVVGTSVPNSKWSFTPGKILLVLLLLAGAAGVGRWVGNSWLQSHSSPQDEIISKPTQLPTQPTPSPQFSTEELNRKQQLRDRRQQLSIDYKFYAELVNQIFWEQHPERRGQTLTTKSGDAASRAEWDKTAAQLLAQLQLLSPEARRRLGNYTAPSALAQAKANKLHVSSRALYDLTDAAFFELFPQQRGKKFINQPIGQIWYALVADKLNAISAGTALEKIVFDLGATGKQISGNLKPGEGKIYIANLAKGQLMKLDLQAGPQVLISVYSPSGKTVILADSSDRAWSGILPEAGFYEFVVVSTASEPTDYQLNLTAETAPANTDTFSSL